MTDARWVDLAAAYALDALEPEERSAFEDELARDPALRALVDEYRGALGAVADMLPRTAPPPGLKERLLAEARRVRPVPVEGPTGALGAQPVDRVPRVEASRGFPFALAASVILALALGFMSLVLARRSGSLEDQVLAMSDELASVRAELLDSESRLARFDSIASAFTGGDLRFASLSATAVEPRLNLIMNREDGVLLVAAANLPPAPTGRTYQLWGIREGEDPVSLGVFESGANNAALQALELLSDAEFDVAAVTEEPDGGSPLPTTTPFLVGPWTAGTS